MSRTVTATCDVCGEPATVALELRNCVADICAGCVSANPPLSKLLGMQEKGGSWYVGGQQFNQWMGK